MKFEKKIERLRIHFQTTNAGLEKILGLSNGYISNIENNEVDNPGKLLVALSSKGISTDWFLFDDYSVTPELAQDDEKLTSKPNYEKSIHEKANKSASLPALPVVGGAVEPVRQRPPGVPLVYEGDPGLGGGIVIPLLENAVSAGYGAELGGDDAPARYVRVPHFLARYPHLASLPVKGDSMEPTLHDGDLVVCDGGGWDGDGLYVIKTYDTAYVKRVQLSSGGYKVISDNKMYESFTESAGELSVVGKVRAIVVVTSGRRGGL